MTCSRIFMEFDSNTIDSNNYMININRNPDTAVKCTKEF